MNDERDQEPGELDGQGEELQGQTELSEEEAGGAERLERDEVPDDPSTLLVKPEPEIVVPEDVEMEEELPEGESDEEVRARLKRLSRRGFIGMAAAAGAGYLGWEWLTSRPKVDGRVWPLRGMLQWNEKLAMGYFDRDRLSPTFSPAAITAERVNGGNGLSADVDLASWRLRIEGAAGADRPVELSLSEVKSLPQHEMITALRCIEGWMIVVRWTGARLIDLMAKYPPMTRDGSAPDPIAHPERLVRYVAMETPGRGYYVGLDMASATHPQTLLVWAMNGRPLSWRHGAPLRLAIPVKYGIKNIKKIGTIRYTDVRPADFWADRGYDWYAGH